METLTVNIFGSEYKIKTDKEGEYLLKVAKRVDEKMQEVYKLYPHPSTAKIAVLACLNFVDESLQKERGMKERLEALSKKIDTAL